MRIRLIAAAAALLAACDHGWPFNPGDFGRPGPFDPTPPVRLTFNPGADRTPLWLPGGAALWYSAERVDRADRDHCFARLPSGGGSIAQYACRTTAPDDSLDVYEDAAVSPGGQLVYVRAASHRFPRPVTPDAQALVVASLDAPNAVRVLQSIPYSLPLRPPHQGVSHVGWLGPDRIVYLGERVTYPQACSSCAPDTVRTGLEIVLLDFSVPTPVLTIVPGTDGASSLAVGGGGGDTIYFTRNGDSRVYRRALSSGQTDTIHDFGAAGIARGVAVAAGRLVAVVGGAVTYTLDSILGPEQVDDGGPLTFVTLATGAESVVGNATSRFRRPAFAPDGSRVAVETLGPGGGGVDLWLVNVP